MNPFDLRGPQFLLFYVLFSFTTILVFRWLRDWMEQGPVPQISLDDPYFVAYLRDGVNEALRMAIVVLLDRGSLVANDTILQRNDDVDPVSIQHPVEKEVFSFFAKPHISYNALHDGTLGAFTYQYEAKAEELGLLPNVTQRRLLYGLAAALLAAVAILKIGVALSRGRTNILFLIILGVLVQVVLVKIIPSGRSPRANALLSNLRTLFSDLEDRRPLLTPGSGTKEVAWLVAVFGLSSLRFIKGFPDVKALFPQSTATTISIGDSGSSCGAVYSCGGGGSSGCGSGCGGGGCGGGCGGCGS